MIYNNVVRTLRRSWASRGTRYLQSTASSINGSNSTVNPFEIAHFSRLSSLWWDEHGEFGLLHQMNPVRMQFIREKVLEISQEENGEDCVAESSALEGLDILDVGCGGGLLSEVYRKTIRLS